MRLIVNGETREVEAESLAELWRAEAEALALEGPQGVAIAVNGEVAPRAAWETTPLAEGDRVEIVRAMRGG